VTLISDHGPSILSEERLQEPQTNMSESKAETKKGRRYQVGVMTLIVLVASCSVILWAARSLWESQHPAYGAARGLHARSPSERVNAIRLTGQLGIGDATVAIPLLIAALTDPEPEVRVAACEALGPLVSDAVTAGKSSDAVRAAIPHLIGSLNDSMPDVRIAAARTLEHLISSKRSAGVIDLEGVFVAFLRLIGDPDADVRIAALDALGSTARKMTNGPPAALTANLADESAGVRRAAVRALACFQRDLDRWIPSIFDVLDRE
jgi:HEAT repeat protein